MKQAIPGLVSLTLACFAGGDELTDQSETAVDLADRCDAVVSTISDLYSESFDKIVARKTPRDLFSSAISAEMRSRFENSDVASYGAVWETHFSAVGDQLAPELITGYIHYQCHTDTLSTSIEAASDPIDAACWNVAHDGKMEILDARMQLKDATDLQRLSRAKILACITMSLSPPPER